ncbi:DMT family transporter [Winogradskyella sp. SYSU M77433]|uniref:DMT family transporter n=1 Tax=Winogradskyella sp. SYSU M77433 TaxID=3042722 RepID=UPI00247FE588|nr:DMT family transporter [Winogradskyella sp. SYSU M77433]MDH7914054.1 DMT family transporter [Winogradskyella sp. SYSU M77433]
MYLLLSILCSTLIFVVFKTINKYNISTLQVIVLNYFVACAIGLFSFEEKITPVNSIKSDWFLGALFLGFLFISIFFVMAKTAQNNGVSVASVASKMSVVLPIIFGIYVYHESTGLQKILGIVLALVAVYLTSVKSSSNVNFKKNLLLPIILFFGSGTIDTTIKYIETTYVPEKSIPLFSASIFGIAAILGIIILVIKREFDITLKAILGGLTLGIINYGSIYFLLKALDHELFESSTLFTVNNVGVVMLSTLTGLIFFKEHLSKTNWAGILLAVISIILVTLN